MYYNLNDNGGFLSPRSIIESYNMTVAKENDKLKKQLEAYKNMRKEAIDCINNFDWFDGKIPDDIEDVAFQYCMKEDVDELMNILNKVGDSDE